MDKSQLWSANVGFVAFFLERISDEKTFIMNVTS